MDRCDMRKFMLRSQLNLKEKCKSLYREAVKDKASLTSVKLKHLFV